MYFNNIARNLSDNDLEVKIITAEQEEYYNGFSIVIEESLNEETRINKEYFIIEELKKIYYNLKTSNDILKTSNSKEIFDIFKTVFKEKTADKSEDAKNDILRFLLKLCMKCGISEMYTNLLAFSVENRSIDDLEKIFDITSNVDSLLYKVECFKAILTVLDTFFENDDYVKVNINKNKLLLFMCKVHTIVSQFDYYDGMIKVKLDILMRRTKELSKQILDKSKLLIQSSQQPMFPQPQQSQSNFFKPATPQIQHIQFSTQMNGAINQQPSQPYQSTTNNELPIQ